MPQIVSAWFIHGPGKNVKWKKSSFFIYLINSKWNIVQHLLYICNNIIAFICINNYFSTRLTIIYNLLHWNIHMIEHAVVFCLMFLSSYRKYTSVRRRKKVKEWNQGWLHIRNKVAWSKQTTIVALPAVLNTRDI